MILGEEYKHLHFIGIGGVSMSALAKLAVLKGCTVTGSDKRYSREAEELAEWGIYVYIGADEEIIKKADLVVFSQAIPADDEELGYCLKHSVKIIRRDYFLAEISEGYDRTIAVAGTHGKTTVTAMLARIFREAGELFTAHIGGNTYDAGNLIYKGEKYFITEACEYKRSFLALRPDIAVVLNVELDHPDTYRSQEELFSSFTSFICNVKHSGIAIINADSDYYHLHKCTYKDIYTYAIDNIANCRATNIRLLNNGRYGFRIEHYGYPNMDIELKVAGRHNIYNALAAYLAAAAAGVDRRAIAYGLASFGGVMGRYEYKGIKCGAEVYVDYAHHPTEIAASVATARACNPSARVAVVFQPHTLSRTEALFDEFVSALQAADSVFLVKEYKARETSGGKTAYDLYAAIASARSDVFYYPDLLSLAGALSDCLNEGDVLLVLGAGDVNALVELL